MEFGPVMDQELAEISQLNGLFLSLLQQGLKGDVTVPGLSHELRFKLLELKPDALQRMAAVPRCLFALNLEAVEPVVPGREARSWEAARRAFAITALYAAWKASRRTTPTGKTLFALGTAELRKLRTLAIADLLELARRPSSVVCALTNVPCFWSNLIRDASLRQPVSRNSILVALATANRWCSPAATEGNALSYPA